MKRDLELIAEILKYVKVNANSCDLLVVPDNKELKRRYHTSPHVMHYHVHLCVEAGFLNVESTGIDVPGTRIPEYGIIDLTWDGHEYLEPTKRRSTPGARGVKLHGND